VANSPFGYMEYLPRDYASAPTGSLPIIVHLHGIGERIGGASGTAIVPLEKTAQFGPYASYLKVHPEMQAIVLMPQAKKLSLWGAADVEAFMAMALAKYPKADPKRLHLWGLSLGGFGVNSCMQVASCAAKVTTVVSICPGNMLQWGGSTNVVTNKIPYWGVHAEDDQVVTIQNTTDPGIRNLASVLGGAAVTNRPELPDHPEKAAGKYYASTGCWDAVKKGFAWLDGQEPGRAASPYCFTSYSNGPQNALPDSTHWIWTRVYSDLKLYNWSLGKVRP
jgi:hypothetical protein